MAQQIAGDRAFFCDTEIVESRTQNGCLTPLSDLREKEIAHAGELSIKEGTVKKSLLRIYDKLGVSNRVELVLYALSHREECASEAKEETVTS